MIMILDDDDCSLVQARVMDVARIEGKIDTEFKNRKEDIEAIKTWYSPENDTRKVEIEELGKLANKENEARKEAIDKLEAFVKSASVSAVGDLDARINAEAEARSAEDAALGDRITSIGKIEHLCVCVQIPSTLQLYQSMGDLTKTSATNV